MRWDQVEQSMRVYLERMTDEMLLPLNHTPLGVYPSPLKTTGIITL